MLTVKGVSPAPYEIDWCLQPIVDLFYEMGPAENGDVITWSSMHSWVEMRGHDLSEFFVLALRVMAKAYVGMTAAAQKRDCPNPTKTEQEQREAKAKAKAAAAEQDEEDEAPARKRLSNRKVIKRGGKR